VSLPGRHAGRPRARRQAGFTLLEIMVVVVLIALSASLVVINLERDTDQVAELEARRFARLIEQARDESILSGRPLAVDVRPEARTYTFLQHRGGWAEVTDDDVFRMRRFPEYLGVDFETAGPPGAEELLVIEGLGLISPFQLTLEGEDIRYRVRIDDGQNVLVTSETDATG